MLQEKNMKNIVATILLVGMMCFILPMTFAQAEETATGKALAGLEKTAGAAGVNSGETDPALVIGKAIEILISILGIIFLIIVVIGGITWMTAGGAPESVKKGQDMIIEGAIGMAICLGAYAISYFVVQKLTEAVAS